MIDKERAAFGFAYPAHGSRFGKLHVRIGKGARGSGPRERMVPLINKARATLEWFVEDVRGQFDADHARPGAPLLPSERKNTDGTCARVGAEALRAALASAAERYLPDWPGRITPHLLRHFCASQLYGSGMDPDLRQEVNRMSCDVRFSFFYCCA